MHTDFNEIEVIFVKILFSFNIKMSLLFLNFDLTYHFFRYAGSTFSL